MNILDNEIGDAATQIVDTHILEQLFANSELTAQWQLLERILTVLVHDERFLAAWLAGSFARDEGDAQSDLDVHVAIADDVHPVLVAHWGEIVDSISPTVLKRLLRFGGTTVVNAITPDWKRFDLTLEPLSAIGRPIGSPRLLLFDRDEVNHHLGGLGPEGTVSPDDLRSLVEDFLRVLGLLTVVVERGEYLVGMDGVLLLRRYLIDLMLAENGVSRRGALRLNQLLTAEQRAILEQIPPLSPTRESTVEAHLACARAFDGIVRRLLSSRGATYPNEFDAATRAQLHRNLGDERWLH